jgi:hypothetical protein
VIPARLTELWEDLRWGVGRALRRLGGGASGDPQQVFRRRRRAAVVLAVLALAAVYLFVPVPGLPCEASPAKTCVPADDAIALVPADAAAYLHLNLDRDSDQFATAQEVLAKLPHAGQIEQGLFRSLGLAPRLDAADFEGWIGDEAAFAALGPDARQRLVLLSVRDEKGADKYLATLGQGKPRRGNGGLRAYSNGIAFTRLNGFLVLGPVSAVSGAIGAAHGHDSLADSERADEVRNSLPDQRIADVYLSPLGIERLLAGRGALSSQLDTFVDFGASRGIAAALVAHGNGLELKLDSAIGGPKKGSSPSFFQAFSSFNPSLAGEFSPQTLLLLEIADPARTVRALLRQAGTAAPGLFAAFARFEAEVRRGGVDIERGVLPVLSGESALGIASGRRGPYLTAVFKDVDEDRAREEMAKLQAPLVAALSPSRTGQAPGFAVKHLDGVVMRSVRISPSLEFAYAIFDGKLVVSTSPAGVREAVSGDENLGGSDAFQAATSGASGGVSALVFLNLEGLVSRSEPLGLGQIVRGFADDVARLKGLRLTETSDADRLSTTLFLAIE